MLKNLSVILVFAALAGTWACDTRTDSARPADQKAAATEPAPPASATPAAGTPAQAMAAAPADDRSAASADNSERKAAGRNPLSRLASKDHEYREMTLPAGTVLPVELQTTVASGTSNIEDPVRATLRRAVTVDGVEVLPAGSTLSGVVTDARRSGRVKGRARVAFRFQSLQARNERFDIRTGAIARTAPATKKQDAAKIGIGAGAGAVIGGIVGGGDGAAKGAAIGGAGGTGVVLATRGKEVTFPAGANLSVRLSEPITIRVPVG